jgi:hypothetical protein
VGFILWILLHGSHLISLETTVVHESFSFLIIFFFFLEIIAQLVLEVGLNYKSLIEPVFRPPSKQSLLADYNTNDI